MWKQSAIVFDQCQSSDFSTFLAQIKANRWANSLIELVKSKRNWLSALDTSICIYIFIHFPFFAIDRSVVEWVPRTSAWPAFGKLYIDDWAWWRGKILLFYFPPFFRRGILALSIWLSGLVFHPRWVFLLIPRESGHRCRFVFDINYVNRWQFVGH